MNKDALITQPCTFLSNMFRFGRNGFKSSYNCCKPNQDLGIL